MDLAVGSGLALGAAGIASATALDVAIDRAGHSHASWAYRNGSRPTQVLFGAGALLTAAGLGARMLGHEQAGETLSNVGIGAFGAWAATFGVRLGVGMLFSPAGRGMKWNPGDIAKNSIDRTHMMSRVSRPHEQYVLGKVSELQGHGSYRLRLERGDFEPLWPK